MLCAKNKGVVAPGIWRRSRSQTPLGTGSLGAGKETGACAGICAGGGGSGWASRTMAGIAAGLAVTRMGADTGRIAKEGRRPSWRR